MSSLALVITVDWLSLPVDGVDIDPSLVIGVDWGSPSCDIEDIEPSIVNDLVPGLSSRSVDYINSGS